MTGVFVTLLSQNGFESTTGGYIYQVVSGEFPFTATFQKKNRAEKFPFVATNDWIVSAVWWSVKYFFLNSPKFWQSSTEKGEAGNSKALCFTSKHN